MKTNIREYFLLTCLFLASIATASTHYVSLDGTHTWPFTNMYTAATNIQDAIDATPYEGLVLVSNGMYQTGGKLLSGTFLTNRVFINKKITLRSINGPSNTYIIGKKSQNSSDLSATRCVFMSSNAVISGFTLYDGHTLNTNIVQYDKYGGGALIFGSSCITNCIIRNCSGFYGGGIYIKDGGNIRACEIRGNNAMNGAGIYTENGCSIETSTIAYNTASSLGGGINASASTVKWCYVQNNQVGDSITYGGYGGGAYIIDSSLISHTHIRENAAYDVQPGLPPAAGAGGGVFSHDSCVCNCLVVYNEAIGRDCDGGGIAGGTVESCTICANYARGVGAGVVGVNAINTIVYCNYEGRDYTIVNYNSSSLSYCCTQPLPAGDGNTEEDPLFVSYTCQIVPTPSPDDDFRLMPYSVGIDMGTNDFVTWEYDLDGSNRIINVISDMGCYESAIPEPNILLLLCIYFACYSFNYKKGNRNDC